jgi:hypothetical protein
MDLFIHSAAGAFIGWALPPRREGPSAAPFVIAGALLPDADIFIEPFLDPSLALSIAALPTRWWESSY